MGTADWEKWKERTSAIPPNQTASKCGKVHYKDKSAALDAVREMDAKKKFGNVPYECVCGSWHIGHPRKES